MRAQAPFGPVVTAVVTPFGADGSVDQGLFGDLLEHCLAHGSTGFVVTGTTGESPTLSDDEKLALYTTAVDAVAGRAAVIAGATTYDTAHSVRLCTEAEQRGVDGILAVTPYYSRPPQNALQVHFRAIADAVSIPVMVYDIPGRTGRAIELPTKAELATHPRIVALKDAADNLKVTTRTIAAMPGFAVYSGDDINTLPMMAVGAVGVVSVVSHLAGTEIRAMIEAFQSGNVAEAAAMHQRLTPLFDATMDAEPNPIAVRAGLELLGLPVGPPRLPLLPAQPATVDRLKGALADLGLL